MSEAHFFWTSLIPGMKPEYNHVVMAAVTAVVLVLTTAVARAQLASAMRTADGAIVPDSKLTYRNFFEIIAEKLYALCESVLGHEAPVYFPFVGALFVFVFAANLIGMIPGMPASTDNINTTFAIGLFTFLAYNYAGLKEHGISYFKQFLGPILWLSPLMLVIEIASHLFRPLSLALRLRGNIYGDHIVLHQFSEMAPFLVPIIFYGLGLFVCFIQAFVFSLMTMVYISLSTSHDH